MVRFKKNNFFKEKNPTLGESVWNFCDVNVVDGFPNAWLIWPNFFFYATVNFPVKDMELRDYIPSLPRAPEGEKVCSSLFVY